LEIVYCGGCGKALREDEFARGQARFLDNRPWCSDCKPPDKQVITGAIPTQRKQGSSAKHPRVTPGTGRREVPATVNKTLLIGVGIAAVAVLLLAMVYASNNRPPPPPPDKGAKAPVPPPPPPGEDLDRVIRDLESFASLAAPDKILARCDELRSKLRGTPQEARFKAVEAAAIEQKKGRESDRELEAIQKIIDGDPRFLAYDEVVRRLKAAKLDRRYSEYLTARKLSPHEKHAGPFEADEQGYIRNWLILGVFPNDGDKGLDTDFLNTEPNHDPVAGKAVGNASWAAHASAEAKVSFFNVPHLGIPKGKDNAVAYAACLVQVPGDVAAEFRVGSDDGCALWVDGNSVGKVHKPRSLAYDNDRYAIPLSPGVHRVLLKVENHSKGFEFALRIVGPDGNRVPSLRIWN
jgi:hypothetical protein